MPSDLIRGWMPVRVKETRQKKNRAPRVWASLPPIATIR
jgi:hypothetical protein